MSDRSADVQLCEDCANRINRGYGIRYDRCRAYRKNHTGSDSEDYQYLTWARDEFTLGSPRCHHWIPNRSPLPWRVYGTIERPHRLSWWARLIGWIGIKLGILQMKE